MKNKLKRKSFTLKIKENYPLRLLQQSQLIFIYCGVRRPRSNVNSGNPRTPNNLFVVGVLPSLLVNQMLLARKIYGSILQKLVNCFDYLIILTIFKNKYPNF